MPNNEVGMQISKLLAASSPQTLGRLKFKLRKMKYADEIFMSGFDYAIDKGWIEELSAEVRITDRGLEEVGSETSA
jgi:hypothetical protein